MEQLHELEGQTVTVVYRGGWLQGTLSKTGNEREWIVTTLRGAHTFWESSVFQVNTATAVIQTA